MLPAAASTVLRAVGLASVLFPIVTAQSCSNYGISSGSNCLCLPGFGGANCSQPACGGTIFDGSNRSLTPFSASGSLPNVTSSGCSCTNGWTGEGCNVCTTASACQTAYAAVGGNASSSTQVSGINDTMVCNTSPQVWAAGELSCQVNVCAFMLLSKSLTHPLPEPNVTSDLPIAVHAQHSSDPQCFPLATAQCFWHVPVP